MAKIIIIDDDPAMELLSNAFHYRGHDAHRVSSVTEALGKLGDIVSADAILLDIMMPCPDSTTSKDLGVPSSSGMELLRAIRKKSPSIPIIVLSAIQDTCVIDALKDDPATKFVSKWESHPIREIISFVYRQLGISQETPPLRPFIVHGHAEKLKLELKNYLQNTLGLPEPIILHEQPNLGRTLIEKFEDCASASAIVFVLLTPDDIGADVDAPDDTKRRARQNVIFEMGYFLGMLGRESGRVLLLYNGPLELPSDLSGLVYIDIARGIEAAGELIRREIRNVTH